MNYSAETSVISNLSTELTGTLPTQLKILDIKDVAEEMTEANNSFNQKFLERIEESANDASQSSGELIKVTTQKYRELCKHIEAHATITPSDAYNNLISNLNSLIERYNSTMALRGNAIDDE